MKRWALVSGLQGDLKLYEQIQHHLSAQREVDSLFVLGDFIVPERNCKALGSTRNPKRGDLKPDCIYGWWEEQLLAEQVIGEIAMRGHFARSMAKVLLSAC